MSSKCTAAKAYDILGIYDFPDNFDALNGLHSYLYTNSDMVVEALASQKYDLARDIVTAIETVDKDGSYDDCAFYVSRDGIRILRTAEELIDALGDENGKTASTLLLQHGGFRSDWDNPDYDPIGDFKETAGDEYRIPLLKVLLREQLESRYEVANHFSTMNRARVELSAFIQNEGGAPLPEDALGTPEEQGIRAMLIATGEPPREVTLLPDKNGSTLKPLQALVGGNIETFDIAFGEEVSLYVNEEGLFTCPPNRAIFATEEMAKAGYLSHLDYSKVVEMGDFYTVLNGDIVAVGFDPETGESRSLTDGELSRVEGYFTVISEPGSGEKAVDAIRHGMEPCGYDISVETHDMASGKDALLAGAPQRDAPAKDTQNIG